MDRCDLPCQLCASRPLEKFEIPGSSILWRCPQCNLYQNGELVGESAYSANYHAGYARHRERKIRTASLRLNRLRNLFNTDRTPRILDIGCSVGATLEAAERIGWKATGVDVSDDAVQYCLSKDLHAVKTSGERLPFQDRQFDAVVNWHVIEHVADVHAALKEWSRVLKPGGLMMMETPDGASPKVRRLGPKYRKFWAAEHTYTFNYENLSRFAETAGLEVEALPKFGPLRQLRPLLSTYALAYQAYQSLRHLAGVHKAFQICLRKPIKAAACRSRKSTRLRAA